MRSQLNKGSAFSIEIPVNCQYEDKNPDIDALDYNTARFNNQVEITSRRLWARNLEHMGHHYSKELGCNTVGLY